MVLKVFGIAFIVFVVTVVWAVVLAASSYQTRFSDDDEQLMYLQQWKMKNKK